MTVISFQDLDLLFWLLIYLINSGFFLNTLFVYHNSIIATHQKILPDLIEASRDTSK